MARRTKRKQSMKKNILSLLFSLNVSVALAQYSIDWSTIDGSTAGPLGRPAGEVTPESRLATLPRYGPRWLARSPRRYPRHARLRVDVA